MLRPRAPQLSVNAEVAREPGGEPGPDPTCLGRKAWKLVRVGVTAATVQVGGPEAPVGLSAEGPGGGAASAPGPPFTGLGTSPDQPQRNCLLPVLIDAAS